MKHTFNKIFKPTALVIAAIALNVSLVHAAPLPALLAVTGDTTFDDDFSFGGSGDFRVVQGGAPTISTYDTDSVVNGANPLSGTFTAIDDGTGFTGNASVTDSDFAIGFDSTLSAMNNDAAPLIVIFRLNWSNLVFATGDDAYADTELLLSDDVGEIFFSDFKSDTLNGNELAGDLIIPEEFGGTISDSGNELFTYILNPGESVNLALSWTLEGGDFEGGTAGAALSASLTIVPVPAAAWLFGSALFGLVAVKRRKGVRGCSD